MVNMWLVLHGWLTTKAVDDVEVQLKEKARGEYLLPLEIAEEEHEEVPPVLETMPLQPFENLIEMYDYQNTGELDQRSYTAPFYLVFFDDGGGLRIRERFSGWETFISVEFFHFDKGMNCRSSSTY